MIYLVSGFMCSGTSAVMRALEAGGMAARWSAERDARMHRRWGRGDSALVVTNGQRTRFPNRDGYRELTGEEYRRFKADPTAYDGKLVKCLYYMIETLPPGEYACVFMRRERSAIIASMRRKGWHAPEILRRADFAATMDQTVARLRDRRSFVSVHEMWLPRLIADPVGQLGVLAGLGWPFDPAVAAKVISLQEFAA